MSKKGDVILDFQKALYHTKCETCKDELQWEANFDADGTTYYVECCGTGYWLSPATVRFTSEPAEDE